MKTKKLCCSLSQDPSIAELRPFPLISLYVVHCPKLFLQSLFKISRVSIFHWLPSVFHPLVSFIQVSEVSAEMQECYCSSTEIFSQSKLHGQPLPVFRHHNMFFCFFCFLSGSVVLCYFIALASVYGNSVALLKRQLKMASFSANFSYSF